MSRPTVPDLLLAAAARSPQRPIVRFLEPPRTLTAADLATDAGHWAGALRTLGVSAGDRVAMFLDNRPEFLGLWFGCATIGAVSVPLNTALRGDILTYMLRQTAPVVIVVEAAAAATIRAALPTESRPHLVAVDGTQAGTEDGEELLAAAHTLPPRAVAPHELASILYTSGTTGPSKGVMCSHRMLHGLAESARVVLGHGPDDVAYTCLPLFHANALFTSFAAALLGGGRTVVAPRFSATTFWSEIAASEATIVNLLGSMAPILWRRARDETERAHRVRIGLVVPSPKEHHEAFERRFGFALTELYGLTDFGIPLGIPFGERRPGSCGRPLPGWRCEVVSAHDEILPTGDVGELVVRPEQPYRGALGYWHMADATVDAWRNLWFHTGDLMRRDEDGWFYFVDRMKDAIRRFGENISSFEVEQVLLSHPDIVDAAVYAVPSELAEDEVMAALVVRPGSDVTPAGVAAFCEPRLPYFAVPRYVEFLGELPRTETEKLQKSLLRARAVTPTTWDGGRRGRKARPRPQTDP